MRLEKVSERFDKTSMWDAYTGQLLSARCQVTTWDTPRRDGMTTIRRTLYMSNRFQLPPRGAVIIGGDVWIISPLNNIDTWGNHISRKGFVAQYAKLGAAASATQLLEDKPVDVYLSRVWVKDTKDIVNTSEGQGQYYIYYVQGEPVFEGGFILSDGRWHIVKNIITGTAGLMIAECNELEQDCIVEVQVTGESIYNPVTETYETLGQRTIKALLLDWREDYTHVLPSFESEQVGDKRLRIPAYNAKLVKFDSVLTIKGLQYRVTGLDSRADSSVSVAIRRV